MQLLLISFGKPQDPNGPILAILKEHKNGECASIARNVFLLQTNTSPNNLLEALKSKVDEDDVIFISSSVGPISLHGFPEDVSVSIQRMQNEQFGPGNYPL